MARQRVVGFVVYQLANSAVGNDVGCGFYDAQGKADGAGIAKEMNRYLFHFCFNPEKKPENARHFAEYLLIHLERTLSPEPTWVATESTVIGGLDRNELLWYWRTFREHVVPFAQDPGSLVTQNFTVPYREGLPVAFGVLDEMVQRQTPSN